ASPFSPRPLPVRDRHPLRHQLLEQRRGLPVHRAEAVAVLADALEQRRQADRLRVEHRTAAIARKAVARRPDDVDVARPQRDAFAEDAEALVHQRIQAALEDLLVAVLVLGNAELLRARAQDLDRLGVVDALATLVAV